MFDVKTRSRTSNRLTGSNGLSNIGFKSSSNSETGLLDVEGVFVLKLCQMVNKCLQRSTNEVGDECRNVKRNNVCTGMFSKGEIALFAFIVKCLDDSNSTVIAS